jgi:hypothetical protein
VEIHLKEITIADLVEKFEDKGENGVFGFGGNLDIRPPYQREFIYDDAKQVAVIDTILKGYPLNIMYWALREDNTYEVIDGQQRTISICNFINGAFHYHGRFYSNLQKDEKDKILKYKLMIYVCSGGDSEKLEWFSTINIAGMKLEDQELRNAVYSGPWVTASKKIFSKNNCPAYGLGGYYLNGSAIRQTYFETVIKWICNDDSAESIKKYMGLHQFDTDASEIWLYFQSVINWVETIFPKRRKEMKGIQWGFLYNLYKNKKIDPIKTEEEIHKLLIDDDVTNNRGIYEYLLSGKEKHLNIRAFSDNQKREAYERQLGICPDCNKYFEIEEMEGDHITPWHLGGPTTAENCNMLCREDNRRKGGK